MAYKQNPGRGNGPKTGKGIPAPFKQTMGATGMGAGTAEGKYATKKAKEIGGKVVKGIKKMDKALEGNSDTRSFNEKDTAFGRRSTGARAGEKMNSKTGSPVKQMETINKVVSKAKEIGGKIVGGIKKMDKALQGNSDTRSFNAKDTAFGRRSTGARAGEKVSPAKMKKSPMKQLGSQAVTKMSGKKAPAKMKKC
jgi:hypothetical protein